MNKAQLAIAAAKLKAHYAAEAKKRQATSTGGVKPQLLLNSAEAEGQARDLAGKACGVAGCTVDDAETILRRGTPELIAKVERVPRAQRARSR